MLGVASLAHLVPRELATCRRDGGLPRDPARLTASVSNTSPCSTSASCRRDSCCARSPVASRPNCQTLSQVVPAGHDVRLAVHGGRQAVRRTAARRAHRRQDPQDRSSTTRPPTCVSCGHCRPPRWCSATDCGPSNATADTATTSGTPSRWSRSPSRSCGTPSTSTVAKQANPKRSRSVTVFSSCSPSPGLVCVGVAVYAVS